MIANRETERATLGLAQFRVRSLSGWQVVRGLKVSENFAVTERVEGGAWVLSHLPTGCKVPVFARDPERLAWLASELEAMGIWASDFPSGSGEYLPAVRARFGASLGGGGNELDLDALNAPPGVEA